MAFTVCIGTYKSTKQLKYMTNESTDLYISEVHQRHLHLDLKPTPPADFHDSNNYPVELSISPENKM